MDSQQLSHIYLQEMIKLREVQPHASPDETVLQFFPDWRDSLTQQSTPLSDQRPWMTFGAIAYLDTILTPEMDVYEYGVGGSTLFFAQRVKRVISCEHTAAWATQVTQALDAHHYDNCSIQVVEPIVEPYNPTHHPANPDHYRSSSPDLQDYTFQAYAQSIERFPDQHFDVIVIDGRARPSCFKHAIAKLKPSGYLVLDNAERDTYAYIHAAMAGYHRRDFYGPGPYNPYFWNTSIWSMAQSIPLAATSSRQSFALNQLDIKLTPYLSFSRGFFIEAGANNGIDQSNTLYFETYRNWTGLLIEPIPELADQCRQNRPNCQVENCALVPFDYAEPAVEMRYCNLMSLVKGAQKSEADDLAHIEKGCAVQQIESYELTVPARTLTSILDQHNIQHIDLLSLDVEGFELNVLKGLDFDRYRPTFLLIEARYRHEIDDFLSPFYEPIAELSHHDVLYKSKLTLAAERQQVLTTPVALFIFNRPDVTQQVFDAIATVKPSILLVIADGGRSPEEWESCYAARAIVEQVSWDCQVITQFSDVNLGCKKRVSSGLDWVFSQVEEAIILEDDCVATPSFFFYCQTLLNRYREDERIFCISGDNFQAGQHRTSHSYYFSRYPHIWGWATWRRAWQHFDLEMKTWPDYRSYEFMRAIFEDPLEQDYWLDILDRCYNNTINSWAYIWAYTCWSQNGLTILPDINLISNIGFQTNATHTTEASELANLPTGELWTLDHPSLVARHAIADAYTFDYVFGGHAMRNQINQLQTDLAQSQARQIELQATVDRLQADLQHSQAQLQQAEEQYHQDLSKTQKIRHRVNRLKTRLHEAEATIAAMESSKFWQIRGRWIALKHRIKQWLGIGVPEARPDVPLSPTITSSETLRLSPSSPGSATPGSATENILEPVSSPLNSVSTVTAGIVDTTVSTSLPHPSPTVVHAAPLSIADFAYARLLQTVQPFTLAGPERILNLCRLAERIETENLPGDVIECGVCNGGTAAILAHFASRSPLNRTVWLFDSFEGMPETTEPDGEAAKAHIGKEVGEMAQVLDVLNQVDSDMGKVTIVKGWFQDTFPTVHIPQIALLNIDADWYESVKLCLETFYDAVVPGGFISFDDYGHWPGCKQAVDEFFAERNLPYTLHQVDYTAHWFQKL